jgi:hypothetical protein
MPIDDTERARRRGLVAAHYAAENARQLERILATFSPEAEMLYNRQSFATPETIGLAHGYIGFSDAGGAFAGLHNVVDGEHFTDDEIVIEGRLCGEHVGEFQGFAPSGRAVELPFVAFYRFDTAGKLVSERVVMNLGPLGATPAWQPSAA